MKNSVSNGSVIPVTLSADIDSGVGILIGAMVGVTVTSGKNTETISVALDGVYTLPKATGGVSQGAIVYWDNTAKNVTTTSSANTKIGHAWASAQSGDATIDVKLSR